MIGEEFPENNEAPIINQKKELTPAEKNLQRWNKYTGRIQDSFKMANGDNIADTAILLFRSYLSWTWAVFARETYSMACGTFEDSKVAAAILAVINSKLAQVVEKTIDYVLFRMKYGIKEDIPNDVHNAAIFIGECYRQRIISAPLMTQVLIALFDEKRKYIQTIIKLLWSMAPVLYEDDKSALTIIIQSLYKYQTDKQFSKQIMNFASWKQNEWTTTFGSVVKPYIRIPKRFDLIEEEDQITHDTIDLDEIALEDITADFVNPHLLEEADQMHDSYKKFLEEVLADDEDEEEEIHESKPGVPIDLSGMKSTAESIENSAIQNEELQLKRQVYLTMVSNATSNATAHNLIKLEEKTNNKYNRTIICTVIDYIGMERTYNRILSVIVQFLCRARKDNRKITEELFKANYDQTYAYNVHRITNISSLYAYLLANDEISWAILQSLRLTEEETNSAQRVFIRILVEELAKNMSYDGIMRKLREPDVAVYTQGLFPDDTLDHAEFASAYFTEIKLGLLCENLNKKIEKMRLEIERKREAELRLLQPPQFDWKESVVDNVDSHPIPKPQTTENYEPEEETRKHRHRHRHRHRSHKSDSIDEDDV